MARTESRRFGDWTEIGWLGGMDRWQLQRNELAGHRVVSNYKKERACWIMVE
jgi:hypothetical protein